MRKIALNARFYAHRPTGMQRYAIELNKRFPEHLEPVMPSDALRGPAGHLWEQLYLPSAVRGRLLWSPNNTGPLAVARQICTIHDLIPIDHPEWFNRRFSLWYEWLLPRLARRVGHIIAISEFTKRRIVERLRVPARKVTVIYNGVDSCFYPRTDEEIREVCGTLGLSQPYVLCVGSLEPRKNLRRLMQAWKIAQEKVDREVSLVVVGAPGSTRVFRSLSMPAVPRVVFTGYVADSHLPALYSGAAVMIYPSLYEGFGLPPLEAMACGTPVVTSATSSLPEVVGSCAVLVDPEDSLSIARGLLELMANARLRDTLRKGGLNRAQRFTWEATARATLGLLMEQNAA
jgi:glycosyltransferase involved in cell wall biosynthesis